MEDIPLYNSRITKSYIEYIEKKYPDVDTGAILDHSGIMRYQLEDEGYWLTQKQVDRFHQKLSETINNPHIAREVGRNAPFSLAAVAISKFAMGFVNPSAVYKLMGKIYPRVSRACDIETKIIAPSMIEITVRLKADVRENPHQCQNRMGFFEGIAKLFTNQYAHIDHPTCMHQGGDCCRYIVLLKCAPSFILKKIRLLFLMGAILTAAVLYLFLSPVPWTIACLVMTVVFLAISWVSEFLTTREFAQVLRTEGTLANQIMDQIDSSYTNALIIQEIGQATSSILDLEKLFRFTMETFEKRLDFDRGLIMLANRERTRLVYTDGYGYSEEIVQLLIHTQFHLDRPDSRGSFVRCFKEQKPFLISDVRAIETELSPRSIQFLRKMGTHAFICVPIVYEGKSEGILAVDNLRSKRPLSERDLNFLMGIAPQIGISINNARAYQMVREREESFRALSENAPDIIFTLDTSGRFTYVNPAWEKILGHGKEEVIGKEFVDFIRQGERKVFMKLFLRCRGKKEIIRNYQGLLVHKNGSEKLFDMNSAPNFDAEGNVVGLVSIFKDITEQHNLENELRVAQKMQAIGTLSAGIAHDFNNILTPIIGFAEMLMNDMDKNSKNHWMIERIFHASLRARELVQQILTFSRQAEQEQKPLQISLIIKETLRLIRASLPATIEIRHDINSDSFILGDPTQIHQVVMNLCANAGYAMNESGGVLEVRLADVEIDERFAAGHANIAPGPYIRLTVNDTGEGMTPEIMERIFEPFFTTKERTKGTGMGLSVVHGIVESHKGFITVYSKPNVGTSFNVYVPIVRNLSDSGGKGLYDRSVLAKGNERILLVDDEQAVVDYGKEILETLGYEVTSTTCSIEAFELFRKRPEDFDLVITDMTMPNMSGDRLAKEILRIRPGVPIIICTGFSTFVTREEAEGLGVKDFVSKPMLRWEIAHTIRKVLTR